jgi:hypothetical protein
MLLPTAGDDDTRLLGKVLLESFAQANIWFTINPDDTSVPEELESKSNSRLKLDQEITPHLVRMKLPETGFQAKLSEWLIANLASCKTNKILPVFSLANRLAQTPPSSLPEFKEIDKSYILSI